MKRCILAVLCIAGLVSGLPASAHAGLGITYASSTFGTDAEGWQSVTLPFPSAVPPTILATFTPDWVYHYITIADPDGSAPDGNTQYWQAPAKFLGDQSAAGGGSLEFDIANTGSGYGPFYQEDVVLVGAGITLVSELTTVFPGASITHCRVPLSEFAWHRDGLAGPVATPGEFFAVLGSLTQLFIRAEYQMGPDVEYLQSVALLGVPPLGGVGDGPRVLALALAPPAPNPSRGGTRVDFVLPRDGVADVAVFDAGGRRVATLARGAMPAGAHLATWDGSDSNGLPTCAGLYWVRLASGGEHRARKLVRIE